MGLFRSIKHLFTSRYEYHVLVWHGYETGWKSEYTSDDREKAEKVKDWWKSERDSMPMRIKRVKVKKY